MKTETIYSSFDLEEGICKSCLEESDEILIGDGKCIDCIASEDFFNETMKGV